MIHDRLLTLAGVTQDMAHHDHVERAGRQPGSCRVSVTEHDVFCTLVPGQPACRGQRGRVAVDDHHPAARRNPVCEQHRNRAGAAADVGNGGPGRYARLGPLIVFGLLRQPGGQDESPDRALVEFQGVIRHRRAPCPLRW